MEETQSLYNNRDKNRIRETHIIVPTRYYLLLFLKFFFRILAKVIKLGNYKKLLISIRNII